jgi:hypothetical protein
VAKYFQVGKVQTNSQNTNEQVTKQRNEITSGTVRFSTQPCTKGCLRPLPADRDIPPKISARNGIKRYYAITNHTEVLIAPRKIA